MLLYTMNWKAHHMPILLIASTLAMVGLVIFQYKWINHSRELYNEVFHQRACMALCSTLEEHGEGAICSSSMACTPACTPACLDGTVSEENPKLVDDQQFQTDLRKTLDFYNIDLSYELKQSALMPTQGAPSEKATCVVNIPAHSEEEADSFIILDFPEKRTFLLEKLKFMIGASVIILLFTAIVLLVANWWLMKQKRLLRTNVDMYNNMAHEFRTPLTNINLATSLLSKNSADPNNHKFLDIILRENEKLIQQVERILHLATLDNGDYALHHEQIQLKTLINTVLEEFQIQIDERKAIVHVEEIPSHVDILGDKQHLSNVFRNLIDNALKYSTAQPVISISVKENNDNVVIAFQDNGIGIPASQNKLIFEKFQRIQHGDRHEEKGFGLGLAYVKKIVELHKGSIKVESEMNKGSLFQVYLPKFC
ncbi:MAG TPA: HAMP domain-containing sensor histidine kinase [Saprospiraceae bacterium]|nr:HAMP domain-containing sensor histidine kinase [Saprospiraceae bacterium]